MPLISMSRITEDYPFKVVMTEGQTYLQHTVEGYKVYCRSSMKVPMMAAAIEIPKEDGYVFPSQADQAGGNSNADDAGGDNVAAPDASIAHPV